MIFSILNLSKYVLVEEAIPERLPHAKLIKTEESYGLTSKVTKHTIKSVSFSEFVEIASTSYQIGIKHFFGPMAAKKVDVLEGKVKQTKSRWVQKFSTIEGMLSSLEGRLSNLEDMMKKILELHTQPTTSEAKTPLIEQGMGKP
ncbi:hypothetical protein M5K25_001148 [Dendrobium thyrsiflorum]|uniref:Uncharacterized protein n=1 Tax=Dendrobium thyrsiflorum TaxID=117978 RepID=A0ABD0VVR8_DENTH